MPITSGLVIVPVAVVMTRFHRLGAAEPESQMPVRPVEAVLVDSLPVAVAVRVCG